MTCALVWLVLGLVVATARAQVSVYPLPIPTPQVAGGPYTGYHSYDPTEIQPPPLPAPLPAQAFPIQILSGGMPNMSSPIPGNFLGFSIEMSLADVVIGPNGSVLWPQFLNLMSTLKERSGPPVLRVGGNTQEKAQIVGKGFLPAGVSIEKENIGATGVTNTPTIYFTDDILYAMANVSALLGITWWLGVPFNQTDPPRLQIMEDGDRILGQYVAGYQLGNEPDLYSLHFLRSTNYSQQDYFDEYTTVIGDVQQDTLITNKADLGGPSVCCLWDVDQIIGMGFLTQFGSALSAFLIEHYPTDNCTPGQNLPQNMIVQYLVHSYQTAFSAIYINSVAQATAAGKPVVLLETNTASCGGFLGLSDAFASTLWALDLSMSLASISVQHAMLHFGGQGVYYNPFVPPPSNASAPYQWTVGPIFYAALAVAEALGPTGTARVADIQANGNDDYTPAYAIFENNAPARVVLINYMTSQGGVDASYTASISVGQQDGDGSATPQSVLVRYLTAPSTASKTNITWSGQSFGGYYESDGLLHGQDDTQTVQCANGMCNITVPAPGAALVFLTGNVTNEDDVQVFTTTYTSQRLNTATVDQAVLATSNGISGAIRAANLGSTSSDSNIISAARRRAGDVESVLAAAGTALVLALLLRG